MSMKTYKYILCNGEGVYFLILTELVLIDFCANFYN